MERDEVRELHFITSINNLGSILARGILSHNRAARINYVSVASEAIQDRRRGKSIPGGSSLHSYANVYFHARNPMMRRLLGDGRDDLIVVRVSQAVLDIPGAVLADGNAAAGATRFYPSPDGLVNLDSTLIFAKYWTDANFSADWNKKRVRNAEVLVPDMIPSMYIEGCYVDTPGKRGFCREFDRLPAVTINREIYFR